MITGNTLFKMSFEDYRRFVLVPEMVRHSLPIVTDIDATDDKLTAFVNHNRWMVRCKCGGAEYAWEEKLFMCRSCWNADYGYKLRTFKFPANRQQIEVILLRRPADNRNWMPGETLADLKRENQEHQSELIK